LQWSVVKLQWGEDGLSLLARLDYKTLVLELSVVDLSAAGCLYSLDWTTGLTQTTLKHPFECKTEVHSACYFPKVAPLACCGILSLLEVSS